MSGTAAVAGRAPTAEELEEDIEDNVLELLLEEAVKVRATAGLARSGAGAFA